MNQAVQLLARGLQDVWLSGNPQVSFYRSTFKRYVQFGSSIEQFVVPDTGKIVINTKSDLLGYTYLTAHDKATGTLVPGVDWSNIISTVDLNIGNQIIATHDIVYINTIQKALEADTYSSRSQTNTFQPLGFFFDKQALPILALRYTDVRINITWVSAAASKQYVYKCWAHCIRLADEERQFFSTATHRILIPQMQRVMVSNEPNFHGPLKYIAAPCTNYANVYVSSAGLAAAVTNLQALSKTATTADLTWTASAGATSYSINTSPVTTTQTTTNPSSYTFTGLTDGTDYTVTITSISAAGPGGSASPATVFRNKVLGSASIVNNAPGGTAISFPGTVGSYAQIDTRNASPIGNNLFIEAWVYFGTINATPQTIFSMGSSSTEYMSIKVADAGGPEIAGPFTCSQTNGDGTVTVSSSIGRPFTDNTQSYYPGTPGPWRDFPLPQPAQYWGSFQIQIFINKQPGTPAMTGGTDSVVQADFEYEIGGNWLSLGTVTLLPNGVTWPAGSYSTTYTWTYPGGYIPVVKDRNNPTIQPFYRFRLNGYADIGGTFYDLSELLYAAQFVPQGLFNDFKAQANQWNHIAFTWSNDEKTLSSFCNGMWVKTETQTAAAPLFSSRSGLGATYAGTTSLFNGYIRNLRIIQGGGPPSGPPFNIYDNPNFVPDQTFDAGTVPSYVPDGTNVYTLIPFPTP
jgi:hypothetical protein